MEFLKLFTHRRLWATLIAGVLVVTGALGYALEVDVEFLTDSMTEIATLFANLVIAVLALLSFLFPKKFKK